MVIVYIKPEKSTEAVVNVENTKTNKGKTGANGQPYPSWSKVPPVAPVTSTFTFHKNFLGHYSPFAAATFNSGFQEGVSQTMTIIADVKVFEIFATWVYTQRILNSEGKIPDEHPTVSTLALGRLVQDPATTK